MKILFGDIMKINASNIDKFFEKVSNNPPNLKIFVISLFLNVIAIVLNVITMKVYESLFINSYQLNEIIMLSVALFGVFFIYLLIFWTVVAGLSHIFLKFIDGVGEFKKMFEIVGYVNIVIFVGLLSLLILQIIYYNFYKLQMYPIFKYIVIMCYLIYVIDSIVSIFIFAKGIQHTYKLSFKKSLIAPLMIFFFIGILNLIGYVNLYL